jgi:streptomycin 6-kinase
VRIQEGFSASIQRLHGEAGRQWLADLPALLRECRSRWSLELESSFENLSYNLVLPGRRLDGTEIVLKIGVPCRELVTEASALGWFEGAGAVSLLDHDAPRGVLLLERVAPGTPLYKSQEDPEATRTAAALMQRLWRTPPADHPFPSLREWFLAFERLRKRFDGGSGPFPPELMARAESTLAGLNASPEGHVLLHGDLHHANILFSDSRGWVAIDPKGVVGDPGYEVGPFMINQLPPGASDQKTTEILAWRLSMFSGELRIGRERLARWAFCHAVLSALWDFEESAEWDGTLRLARTLERLG